MANWRSLFRPWIMERGQEYFECGQVTESEDDGDLVRAEVSGRTIWSRSFSAIRTTVGG